jgi:hypothetical protein
MELTVSYIGNKQAGVRLQGHSGQKTAFTGTAINGAFRKLARPGVAEKAVKQSGHAILYVKPKSGGPEESYLITLRESIYYHA